MGLWIIFGNREAEFATTEYLGSLHEAVKNDFSKYGRQKNRRNKRMYEANMDAGERPQEKNETKGKGRIGK